MSKPRIGLVAASFLGITMAVALRAQTRPPAPASEDAVAALVVEVRALRTELSQVATASVRSQLLVTRVQLQEQRLMHLDRQRADVSGKLADAEKTRTTLATQLKMFGNPGADTPPQQRREMETMLDGFKAQVQAAQANEAALRTEQDSLLNAISTEQSRWSDFNNRLDELERALPATGAGLRAPGTAR